MRQPIRRLAACGLLLLTAGVRGETPPAGTEAQALEKIVVTATRRPGDAFLHAGNVSRVDGESVERTGAVHVNQLLFRVPGTWISRGSGQEHLTAIRSPVLTGAGACGAFLFLENGIPIRPAGFCNVNQLFEVNSEQADAVEVIRGPGSALYGSNALHGLINFIADDPRSAGPGRVSLEAGSDDYYRARLDTGSGNTRLRFNAADDGSFREAAGFEQYKLNLDHRASDELRLTLAATDLDQDTAGFIFGEDAFRDPALRTANLNPEAFREAESQRLAAHWTPGDALAVRAYGRRSRMTFLRHFVPEQSLEKNGQDSAGVLLSHDWGPSSAGSLITGLDLEYTRGFLEETQDEPLTEGPEFLQETRPAGAHYDYDVDAAMISPYVHAERPIGTNWRVTAGLRAEYLRYDYDNHLPDGNTRDDGTECGLGGCLFNRPADRSDDFFNLAPKLALVYAPADNLSTWLRLARGFRAPQATELYRLQRGQDTADLGSEVIDSLELGIRGSRGGLAFEAAAFSMEKRNVIFTDADGFNVDDGRTEHRGVEAELSYRPHPALTLAMAGTHAVHRYDFTRQAALGESIRAGNEVDTAPRSVGSARALWRYAASGEVELEWVHMGDYYLDAANEHEYGGHDLLNLRLRQSLDETWRIGLRVTNLTDEAYAERADFAFGEYRYFPGPGRQAFVELDAAW